MELPSPQPHPTPIPPHRRGRIARDMNSRQTINFICALNLRPSHFVASSDKAVSHAQLADSLDIGFSETWRHWPTHGFSGQRARSAPRKMRRDRLKHLLSAKVGGEAPLLRTRLLCTFTRPLLKSSTSCRFRDRSDPACSEVYYKRRPIGTCASRERRQFGTKLQVEH